MKRLIILLVALMMSCTLPDKTGLNGVWQYVSGNYTSDDSTTSTTSDDVKSIKGVKYEMFIMFT